MVGKKFKKRTARCEVVEISKDNDFSPPPAIPAESSQNTRSSGIEGTKITVTDDYNLHIIAYPGVAASAGQRAVEFLVSRSALSMSSSVLKDTITRSDLKGQEYHITLEQTDLSSLHIILRILHFDIEDDLMDITFETFVNIAVLCDRYQLRRALRPWVHIWLEKHTRPALDPGYEGWLYISKTFGSEEKLEDLMNPLVDECSAISDCGKYVLRRGKEVPIKHWPEDILDRIVSLRNKEIKRLTRILEILTNFLKHPSEYQNFCQLELCADLAYGSLLRSMERNGLSRLLEPGVEWYGSVERFREKLKAIRIDTMKNASSSHTCSLETIKDRFTAIITYGDEGRDTDSTGGTLLSPVPNLPASQAKVIE